jgi:hypothetical protein
MPVGDTTTGRVNTPIGMPGLIDIDHIYDEVCTAYWCGLNQLTRERAVTRHQTPDRRAPVSALSGALRVTRGRKPQPASDHSPMRMVGQSSAAAERSAACRPVPPPPGSVTPIPNRVAQNPERHTFAT